MTFEDSWLLDNLNVNVLLKWTLNITKHWPLYVDGCLIEATANFIAVLYINFGVLFVVHVTFT